MSLDELYREVIMDHYRAPRNRGELPGATASVQLHNPLCGDDIRLFVKVEDDRISDVRFSGQGCSISQASASLMTSAIKGKTVAEATELMTRFRAMMRGTGDVDEDIGDLEALTGVTKFPVRVKCAVLPWEALRNLIAPDQSPSESETVGSGTSAPETAPPEKTEQE